MHIKKIQIRKLPILTQLYSPKERAITNNYEKRF